MVAGTGGDVQPPVASGASATGSPVIDGPVTPGASCTSGARTIRQPRRADRARAVQVHEGRRCSRRGGPEPGAARVRGV